MDDPDDLDGCDIEFNAPATNTPDDAITALVLFAGVDFLDPAAVEEHRHKLAEWDAG